MRVFLREKHFLKKTINFVDVKSLVLVLMKNYEKLMTAEEKGVVLVINL